MDFKVRIARSFFVNAPEANDLAQSAVWPGPLLPLHVFGSNLHYFLPDMTLLRVSSAEILPQINNVGPHPFSL